MPKPVLVLLLLMMKMIGSAPTGMVIEAGTVWPLYGSVPLSRTNSTGFAVAGAEEGANAHHRVD